jgi:hypothetical protein
MQKSNFLKSPFGIAAIICFVIALVSPFIFVESKTSEKKNVGKVVGPTPTFPVLPSGTENFEGEVQMVEGQQTSHPTVIPTVSEQTQQTSQPTATAVPQPTSAPAVKTFQVSLKINGSLIGNVDMQEGNNQCDVLTRAKDQGKISSLTMRYINDLGTYGVYQINGIGKENTVWWVYKINGQSPTQGCSYIKANSGETVEWEYKG